MKSIIKKLIILFIAVILTSNFIKFPNVGQAYTYQTKNKEFVYRAVPSKGSSEQEMLLKFDAFKQSDSEYAGLILHRTFKRNWLKFWNWKEYLTNGRWDTPYLES